MTPLAITITPTAEVVTLNGVLARRWEGTTADGVRCHVFVALVAVHQDEDPAAFDRALIALPPPRPAGFNPEAN